MKKTELLTQIKPHLLITDLGFLVYWMLTAVGVLSPVPADALHSSDFLTAWNWSFLPLDVLASLLGLLAVFLTSRFDVTPLVVVSLTLTHVAGLNAIAFWAIRGDFSLEWWLPNLYLMLFPLWFLPRLICLQTRPITPVL
ncbi:DUF5360 family protein [Deinococcus cellulosilyticus]|uniref:Uncharacterized protein n=1 Tax=Deinococcus cellulosilyticus (strain DSM 18568 / NBRC 106333 / KACC 11606 / 5516J-15) TaxID=1223518 RepID=A0A511MWS5_DEIC1|nr:DUF5360 family protein [Deinococcus cellulosilyticus]GEM44728.1 hypothetical protein DC3_03630 [Deinococcus cellulosilyticus NBRC 106333 = KACC 11606]